MSEDAAWRDSEAALEQAIRDARALRLYVRGMSLTEIAADHGYRSTREVHEAIRRAVKARAHMEAQHAPVTLERVNAEIARLMKKLGEGGG